VRCAAWQRHAVGSEVWQAEARRVVGRGRQVREKVRKVSGGGRLLFGKVVGCEAEGKEAGEEERSRAAGKRQEEAGRGKAEEGREA